MHAQLSCAFVMHPSYYKEYKYRNYHSSQNNGQYNIKSAVSEFSIKSKGRDNENGDDPDVIFAIQGPNCHQFHITIIQLLQSAFFSTSVPHARACIDHLDLLVAAELVTARNTAPVSARIHVNAVCQVTPDPNVRAIDRLHQCQGA